MTTTTLTKTARTVVASQSVAAAGTVRGAVDLRTAQGGLLTLQVANGASGPTTACVVTISVAHDGGSTPATDAEGAVWKRYYQVAGTTVNNDVRQWALDVPPGAMHLQVEFSGHTGQAVTVEALLSEITAVESV
jgi:hypothetical protein